MRRDQLRELHYIIPIANLASILQHGLLSHRLASRIEHESAAMEEIQERRDRVRVPGGRPLHEYVNLYFHARSPMLYKRQDRHRDLCVLRVNPDVLDLPEVVVTDMNASVSYVGFRPGVRGLEIVDYDLTFAEWWTHENPVEYSRRKAAKCAEVLVPDRVPPRFLMGAYVSCNEARDRCTQANAGLTIEIDRHLFFMGGARSW